MSTAMKYVTVPPPVELVDLVTGEKLTEENLFAVDAGGVRRSYKELGMKADVEPRNMHRWFVEALLSQFTTPKEHKAAVRIKRALLEAVRKQKEGVERPVVSWTADDHKILEEKIEHLQIPGHQAIQYMNFFDAVEDAKREPPVAEIPPNGAIKEREATPAA